MAVVPALLLLVPVSALAESAALNQLRAAAESAQSSVSASSLEGASSGNQVWAENSHSAPGAGAVVAGSSFQAPPGASNESSAPQPAPRPNLVANIPPATPKAVEPDPVPPKIKGWEGFKMGFLGMEATAMRLTSKAGKLALPLLILLQPIIAPIALIAGLLGLFGKRL